MYETFGHNRDFCLYTLALIAAAPYGVTEGEIQKLVFEFIPVQEYLKNEDRYSTGLTSLPYIIWSRLFYDLNYCLTTKIQQGYNVVFFKHGIFKQVLVSSFPQYVSAARNLLIKHFNSQSNYYGSQGNANTRKVLSLPILLLQIQDYSTVCDLLCDFTFADSLIRSHRIDETINYYDIALEHAEKTTSLSASLYNLLRIRNCLSKHLGMLRITA